MAFKEATNQAAFLKGGIFGFQGAGKTWTAALIAIGLHKYIKSQKPVYFLDTETGSDFVKPLFDKAKIKMMTDKTAAFAEMLKDIDVAEQNSDILIIDSITHFWRELMRAWKAKRNRTFISIRDFGPLKDEWHQYTTRYVNSRLHIIMCGRASNIFADVEDEDASTENKQVMKSIKVGTKMSAEGETGFEPSLLIEMERYHILQGGKYVRRANVVKERFGILTDKEFDDPTFEDFLPHIKSLNLGGEHVGVGTDTSEGMFISPDTSFSERRKQQTILTEEIEGLLVSAFPGTTREEKKAKADLLEVVFKTRSWTAICDVRPDDLKAGKSKLAYLCRVIAATHPLPVAGEFMGWLQAELAAIPMPEVEGDELHLYPPT